MSNLPTFFDRTFGRHPSKELMSFQRRMDRFFDHFMNREAFDPENELLAMPNFSPTCDISETSDHYLMVFDIPGMKKEEIKIDLQDNLLTVSGERKEESTSQKKGRYRSECAYGTFMRSFTLPGLVKAGEIEANYADGVLRIALPKTGETAGSRIEIGENKTGFFEKFLGRKPEKERAH